PKRRKTPTGGMNIERTTSTNVAEPMLILDHPAKSAEVTVKQKKKKYCFGGGGRGEGGYVSANKESYHMTENANEARDGDESFR
ncbi:unnamed protein product, partial [Ilex paraguariensis]